MEMKLNEAEAHCLARMLQGALYGGQQNPFDGCRFCKYNRWAKDGDDCKNFTGVSIRLTEFTDVDLSPAVYGWLPPGKFPYKKFLKGADDGIKQQFRNFFQKMD